MKRTAVFVGLMLVVFAGLVGLGTWQLQRLGWKEALIARVEARIGAAPVPLPAAAAWGSLDLAAEEYRPVIARGYFRNDLEVRVYTIVGRPHGPFGGPGYFIVAPFDLADGGTVLVNRGFVPFDRADPASRAAGRIEGETVVRGLLRAPERPGFFTPDAKPADRLFYVDDPAPIARALAIGPVAPFMIDADATPNAGGLPQGGETEVTFRNNHLGYAVTWYGLALVVAGSLAAWLLQRRRGSA